MRNHEGCREVCRMCERQVYRVSRYWVCDNAQGMKWGTRPVLRGCEGVQGVSHCHIIIQEFILVNL